MMLARVAATGLSGITNAFALLRLLPGADRDQDAEILALRHQLGVLQRQLDGQRVRFDPVDRAWLAALLHRLPRPSLQGLRLLVRPDTVLRWHRDLAARRHAVVSRPRRRGRPRTVRSIGALVLRLVAADQAQHQGSDRPHRRRTAGLLGPGDARVPPGEEVAVPAQHGVRADKQPDPLQHLAGQPVQQGGQQRPVSRREPDLLSMQLSFEDGDLMPKSQDLNVLVTIAHRQKPEHRDRVGHPEARQSQQHDATSSRSDGRDLSTPRRRPQQDSFMMAEVVLD